MDGFSSYNQINILPENQPKTTFIYLWGTFSYRKLPFSLNNTRATFQHAMDYTFHDIKHIIQAYLDDIPAHSKHQTDHLMHLRAILHRCIHYNI